MEIFHVANRSAPLHFLVFGLMEFDSTPVVVYGIKLANKGVAKLVRRVRLLGAFLLNV